EVGPACPHTAPRHPACAGGDEVSPAVADGDYFCSRVGYRVAQLQCRHQPVYVGPQRRDVHVGVEAHQRERELFLIGIDGDEAHVARAVAGVDDVVRRQDEALLCHEEATPHAGCDATPWTTTPFDTDCRFPRHLVGVEQSTRWRFDGRGSVGYVEELWLRPAYL